MNGYLVKKSALKGDVVIPPSKSQTLRAILLGALGQGKTVIHHPLRAADTQSMVEACRLLGATVDLFPDRIEVMGLNGEVHQAEDVIQAGNSGLVLRFCAAIGALAAHPIVITGDYSIRHHRPMQPLLEGLAQLGVSARSMRGDGYAPIILNGPIQGGTAILDGQDSQPVSALILAAAFADGASEIKVRHPGETPWITLTLDWLTRLGISYEHRAFQHYRLAGNARYGGFEYAVPGDFSSAAFPLAAALITGSELTLHHLDYNDRQGDKALISVFQQMGAVIDIDQKDKKIHVRRHQGLKGIDIDINPLIDALTILAVVACFAEGETWIRNARIAKYKECDRIACITAELQKMGADIQDIGEGLRIRPALLSGAHLHSHCDHRMAMSLAVAGLGAQGETRIDEVACVAKTFPTFRGDLAALGADIQEVAWI